MKTTRISVVIPAYNEEVLLERCLNSLQAQTRVADEIIVVDNASTDQTAAVATKHGARVIYEKEQGIMPAGIAGFRAAKGDIIARCDADSVLPKDWLFLIEQTLMDNPEAVALTGPGKFYDTSSFAARAANIWYMYAYFILVGLALAHWPLFGSNFAMRRPSWKQIEKNLHHSRTDIHDDIDFSIHLSPRSKILFNRKLKVGISARSLAPSGLATRYIKGFRSLYIHWPDQAPWHRWKSRLTRKT